MKLDLAGAIALDGRLDLGVTGSVAARSIRSLAFRADGSVDLDAALSGTVDAPAWTASLSSRDLVIEDRSFELSGEVAGDLDSATFERFELVGAGGRLEVRGNAPLNANLAWDLELSGRGIDFSELEPLRLVVAEASVQIEGPAASPDATASVRLDPLSLNGHALPATVITARTTEGEIRIEGNLDGVPFLTGNLALRAPFPLHLEADLAAVPWNDLARSWDVELSPAFDVHAAGTGTVDVELNDPQRLRYHARVDELTVTTELGTATSSPVDVEGSLATFSIRGLDLRGSRGRVSVRGSVPLVDTEELDLAIDGRLPSRRCESFHRTSRFRVRLSSGSRWRARGESLVSMES